MKKFSVFVLALVALAFTQANAQRVGIRGGANMSNVSSKIGGNKVEDLKSKIGYQFGPVVEFEVADAVALETGLLLSTKGYKMESEVAGVTTTLSSNPMYLELPINLKYKLDLGDLGAYVAAGPYVAYGIGGKRKLETKSALVNTTKESKIEWGNEFDVTKPLQMKPLDYGVNFGLGVEIETIQIGLNYGLGLANTQNLADGFESSDNFAKNRNISLTVTYFFE